MDFFTLPPKNMVLLTAVLGIALAEDLTVDQQNILGNFLMGIGQNIITYSLQPQPDKKDTNTTSDTTKDTQDTSKNTADTTAQSTSKEKPPDDKEANKSKK